MILVLGDMEKLKRGAYRSDGKRFWQYAKNYPNGEYWVDASLYQGKIDLQKRLAKKYFDKDPEKIRNRNNAWALKNRHKARARALKRTFGISEEDFNKKLIFKIGVCLISKKKDQIKKNVKRFI